MFYNTLIKADRWKWYVDGVGKTILISMGAIAIGVIIGIIIAIVSLVGIESTDGYSLILLVISASVIFAGIVFENNLKWKAYMLHTNIKKKK